MNELIEWRVRADTRMAFDDRLAHISSEQQRRQTGDAFETTFLVNRRHWQTLFALKRLCSRPIEQTLNQNDIGKESVHGNIDQRHVHERGGVVWICGGPVLYWSCSVFANGSLFLERPGMSVRIRAFQNGRQFSVTRLARLTAAIGSFFTFLRCSQHVSRRHSV